MLTGPQRKISLWVRSFTSLVIFVLSILPVSPL